MSNIVSLENIKEFQTKLSEKTVGYIFGKGPTFQSRPKESDSELYFCVNDSINQIDQCDILVVNDIETFSKIDKDKLSMVPYLLLPERPHSKNKPQLEKTWADLREWFEPWFQGQYIIYHLGTTPKLSTSVLNLPSQCSGSNTAVDLVVNYLQTIQKVELYGVGIPKAFKYNSVFLTNNTHNPVYSDEYIKRIRSHIETTLKKAHKAFVFH